ncbi:MAG: HlyD family secretion protein [Pleurocapsa sp.]
MNKINNLNNRKNIANSDPSTQNNSDIVSISSRPAPQLEDKKPNHPKPSGLILSIFCLLAIAAGIFGYRWWQYSTTHAQTNDATVTGNIYPVASRISGTVQTVEVEDNQQVKAGQPLVKLDSSDEQANIEQATAALATAEKQAAAAQENIALSEQSNIAQDTQTKGNITDAQAGIKASQAQLKQVEAELNKLKLDYQRYQTLYQEGAVTQQQFDDAKAAYNEALAQRQAAEQAITQARAKLTQAQSGAQQLAANQIQTKVNRSNYAAAQARVTQAEASLKQARLQLSYTTLTAPVAGRVGNKTVQVGQQIQPGTLLMAIVPDQTWITANFKETQLGKIQPGEKVQIKLDAFPGKTFTGTVNSLSPASGSDFALLPPDNATGNFTKVVQRIPVKITFDPQSIKGYESRITQGMSAVVTVDLTQNGSNQ